MSASKAALAHAEGPALTLEGLILPADYASVNAARHPDRVALAFRDWSWT